MKTLAEKIDHLTDKIADYIREEAHKLARETRHQDDPARPFYLPKAVLTVAIERAATQYQCPNWPENTDWHKLRDDLRQIITPIHGARDQ